MSDDELLDPAFVRELSLLRRQLKIAARSGAVGERLSRRKGSSAEFAEHRPYAPGDDPRRIDWLAWARSGTPVVKTFRAEEDAVLRLLIDGSASLGFGTPSKLTVARRLAAALGYVALDGAQRTQVLLGRATDRSALARVGEARRGKSAVPALLRDLALSAEGHVDLAAAVDETIRRATRPGLLVVLSDFFDGGPVLSALSRARAAGHDLSLVQLLADEELQPDLEGDVQLVDVETGETVELTADADALAAYAARLTGLVEELRAFARRHGGSYQRVCVSDALDEVVRRFVRREID